MAGLANARRKTAAASLQATIRASLRARSRQMQRPAPTPPHRPAVHGPEGGLL